MQVEDVEKLSQTGESKTFKFNAGFNKEIDKELDFFINYDICTGCGDVLK